MVAVTEFDNPQAEQDEAPAPSSTSRLVIWLVILSFMLLLLPLYLISTTIQQDISTLESELTDLQATLAYTPPPVPEEEALRQSLDEARSLLNLLQPLGNELTAGHINWPETIAVIGAYDQRHIELTTLTQTENRLIVNGRAEDETAVMAYADVLQESNLFERVIVQSITMRDVPGPTPAAEDAPTPAPQRVAEFAILVELITP